MKYMKLIQAKLIIEVTVMHENKMLYILRKHIYEHGCFAH